MHRSQAQRGSQDLGCDQSQGAGQRPGQGDRRGCRGMKTAPLVALFLSLAILAARVPAWAAEPDPYRFLLYDLLDLDLQELLEPQQRNPLAEVHARAELYAALRAKALTDTTDDQRYLKSFLLIGWIARV